MTWIGVTSLKSSVGMPWSAPPDRGDTGQPEGADHERPPGLAPAGGDREQLGHEPEDRDAVDIGLGLQDDPVDLGGDALVAAEDEAPVVVVDEEQDQGAGRDRQGQQQGTRADQRGEGERRCLQEAEPRRSPRDDRAGHARRADGQRHDDEDQRDEEDVDGLGLAAARAAVRRGTTPPSPRR
jgi:hypothetical protein